MHSILAVLLSLGAVTPACLSQHVDANHRQINTQQSRAPPYIPKYISENMVTFPRGSQILNPRSYLLHAIWDLMNASSTEKAPGLPVLVVQQVLCILLHACHLRLLALQQQVADAGAVL